MGKECRECARGTSPWVPSSGWPHGCIFCKVSTLCPTFLSGHVELGPKNRVGSQMTWVRLRGLRKCADPV